MRIRGASLAVASALAIMIALPGAPTADAAEQGSCAVTAGINGGHKFATLKCAKKSRPGHYVIRSTVWERDGKKAYQDLARFAGHSFTCTLTRASSKKNARVRVIRYKVSNCR